MNSFLLRKERKMSVAPVTECAVAGCSYNHDGCTADAITISKSDASCVTFISLDMIGGTSKPHAHVGACQRLECLFNDHLLCNAERVRVGDDAECLTFTPA